MNRREFLTRSGALVVSFSLSSCRFEGPESSAGPPGNLASDPRLESWIRVDADGTVTVFTGKVELGQGIETALAQIAADELDVSFDRLHMVTADTDRTPDEGYTSGSMSLQGSGAAIRAAAAETRHYLLQLGAERLGVPATELEVEDGLVRRPGSEASSTYWDLVSDRTLEREATGLIPPKDPSRYRYVGKPVPRLDIPEKVFAEGAYVQDLRLPGMLHARVVRPPSYASRLESLDSKEAFRMPGVVEIVRDGSFLAVVAEREEQAIAAAETLGHLARWSAGRELPAQEGLAEHLRRTRSDDDVVSERVDPERVKSAVTTIEADYFKPYVAHASIGPSCALAQESEEKLVVWTHSQGVYPLRGALAKVLRRPEEEIRVLHVDGSGCYGHNGADDVACDAALVARALPGRPVRVQWMREDEFAWEPFGPAMSIRARGAVDAEGRIAAWLYELWSAPHSTRPSAREATLLAAWHVETPEPPPAARNIPQPSGGADRNAVPLYDLPHHRVVEHFLPEMPLRVSALRALGGFANVFAIESFMDELAHAAEKDPLRFRLDHLKDDRAREVLQAVAASSGWGVEKGKGRGLAFARYKNLATYVAIVADVSVERSSGAVRVERAFAAVDAGQIVNPDGLRNQIEGGMVQSTSWTLKEAVRFEGERITSLDWAAYPILTFAEVPRIEVALLDRPSMPPLGAGEASQGPMAAAIANAVFDATGVRFRSLPLTPEAVLRAL